MGDKKSKSVLVSFFNVMCWISVVLMYIGIFVWHVAPKGQFAFNRLAAAFAFPVLVFNSVVFYFVVKGKKTIDRYDYYKKLSQAFLIMTLISLCWFALALFFQW